MSCFYTSVTALRVCRSSMRTFTFAPDDFAVGFVPQLSGEMEDLGGNAYISGDIPLPLPGNLLIITSLFLQLIITDNALLILVFSGRSNYFESKINTVTVFFRIWRRENPLSLVVALLQVDLTAVCLGRISFSMKTLPLDSTPLPFLLPFLVCCVVIEPTVGAGKKRKQVCHRSCRGQEKRDEENEIGSRLIYLP
ncbi:hypothetical protein V8G54_018998 [Vigna mungo]|uniref:Uncharacterized protein n=1 Tax=Vigna mungo TaxID=3915 RepID=A0AAQ3N9P6_VIGMU